MTRKDEKAQSRRKARRRNRTAALLLATLAAAAFFILSKNPGAESPDRRPSFHSEKIIPAVFPSDTRTSAAAAESAASSAYAGTADAPNSSDAENSALYWGNPSGARADTAFPANYLMEKTRYVLSYNSETLIPNWVMWHLCAADLGGTDRSNTFRQDTELPKEWYAVEKTDYQYAKYGFDRGHLCPSADRTSAAADNSETFLMTNMIPQAPDCNRIVWKALEEYERILAKDGKELYIAAGPHGAGGTSAAGYFESIELPQKNALPAGSRSAIAVPAACWKIILVLEEGDDDFSRVSEETPVIAVYIPNRQGVAKIGPWMRFLTTVDDIEEKTGFDFFPFLPDDIESAIEARTYAVPGA